VNTANAVPVVATPLAYGIGFLLLVAVTFGDDWVGSLVTVAHEGGHYFFAVFALRGPKGFRMDDGDNAATPLTDDSWGVGDYVLTFAGYATPPLLGLGGAVAIAHGNAGGVLWIAVILLIAAFFAAGNDLALAVTLLAVIGVGWVAFAGSPALQAGVAVALVWWMLLGGLRATVVMGLSPTSDAGYLARRALLPRIVWKGIWIAIAVLCLLRGGRLLLYR
jgi:Peptidase M50B-like